MAQLPFTFRKAQSEASQSAPDASKPEADPRRRLDVGKEAPSPRSEPKSPKEAPNKPWSVSKLNAALRERVESGFHRVFVEGELRGLKVHGRSGHAYFELADRRSTLPVFMAEGLVRRLGFPLQEGLRVWIWGDASVFEARGRLQLRVAKLEPVGEGALQLAFQASAKRLEQLGLTSASRKRSLPLLPTTIGVVTSKGGAAVRDVIQTALRRDPKACLLIAPTAVQGVGAVQGLLRQLSRLEDRCDVVLLVRGGGSLEDLRAFNEEIVARKVASLKVPVVTGVGHESDLCLVDLVSDARASTPTAAAEFVVPLRYQLEASLAEWQHRLTRAIRSQYSYREKQLTAIRVPSLSLRINQCGQLLDSLEQSAKLALLRRLEGRSRQLAAVLQTLQAKHPAVRTEQARNTLQRTQARTLHLVQGPIQRASDRLGRLEERLLFGLKRQAALSKAALEHLGQRLHGVSPLAVLERGYAVVQTSSGAAVTDPSSVGSGQRLSVRVAKGHFKVVVDQNPFEKGD